MNSAINMDVEDMTADIVRYGLYFTAFFNMMCILAAIFMPQSQPDEESDWIIRLETEEDDDESSESTPETTPRRPIHRLRKQEKKKRR